jgi:NAD-dependent deacetylase
MQDLLQQAADILSHARRLVVLTGAGISKESGIPTFREAQQGLWAQQDPQRLATMQGFLANPKPGLGLVPVPPGAGGAGAAQPRPSRHRRAGAAPAHVEVITQNVDGLHVQAGSRRVLELHGNIRRFKCLRGHTGFDDGRSGRAGRHTALCPHPGCQALVRPDVVWFGENLDYRVLNQAVADSEACDVMLIVGTSGAVQPAASLPYRAWNARARIIEINPEESELSDLAHVHLAGPAGVLLPQVLAVIPVVTH